MSDPGWCGKHNYRSQTTDAVCPHCKRERESAAEIERLRGWRPTMSDELHEEVGFVGSIVTWTFYVDDPEGERKLRQCLDAPDVLLAIEDFERWLRLIGESNESYSVDNIRDSLFDCFDNHGLTFPGWE